MGIHGKYRYELEVGWERCQVNETIKSRSGVLHGERLRLSVWKTGRQSLELRIQVIQSDGR